MNPYAPSPFARPNSGSPQQTTPGGSPVGGYDSKGNYNVEGGEFKTLADYEAWRDGSGSTPATPATPATAPYVHPVAPGYSEIMSNPANRAWNERMLNDPQFAWRNLQSGYTNPGADNPYGSGWNPTTGNGTATPVTQTVPTSTGQNPITNTRPTTPATPTPTTPSVPATSPTPTATSSEGMGAMPFSRNSYYTPTVNAPENQSGNGSVVNAMMRRYNPRYW